MSWDLGLNKTVSRLIPKFLRNPRMFQWVSSLVFPLENVNKQFIVFADNKKREAQLNSQTKLLQDYLNTTFGELFPNPDTDTIQIVHGLELAQATFSVSDTPPANPPFNSGHMILYNENEDISIDLTLGIDTTEDLRLKNNKNISSIADYNFEFSGIVDSDSSITIQCSGISTHLISFHVDSSAISIYVYGGIAPPPQQSIDISGFDFGGSIGLKLHNSTVYLNGVDVGEINQDLLDEVIDISVDTTAYNPPTIPFNPQEVVSIYASVTVTTLIAHGFTLNGEVFKFNEGEGSVVSGVNGTIGEIRASVGVSIDDLWIDTKLGDAGEIKESPFVYFDYEDFGTLPEDFRLILPSSIEGNQTYVGQITEIVDRYVIDINKYDIVYS